MELRNKKTGEIKTIEEIIREAFINKKLETLKRIDDNWEDCNTKEPLIKDDKIRKAVRAWAEVNRYDKLWVYHDRTAISFYNGDDIDNEITFKTVKKFGLEHLKCYTITELCGEEE